ncbi:MAG: DUF1211 domain-containing protein [Chitinophagaceae bacterium]|nr:DUF1211 domain-containing protein [Chitinophagaceae bacterium]
MSDSTKESIHKEFELERMILFSDAVFAIAITLLIIEIKFPQLPEGYRMGPDLWQFLKPTLKEFLAFALSFFFIGVSWARHLKMFRYLRAYNDRVIFLNLFSMFFIVTFPFSASAFFHFRPDFMFPMVIYFGNVMMIFTANFLLSLYIFKRNTHLSVPGFDAEKKYIYLVNRGFAISLCAGFLIILIAGIATNFRGDLLAYSCWATVLLMLGTRRWAHRYKPKKETIHS